MTIDNRRSPLAHREAIASGADAALSELAHRGFIILRGGLEKIGGSIESALGAALPPSVGETAHSDAAIVLWLGPDEWVFVTKPGDEAALLQRVAASLGDTHHQAVDVTDYYTTIEVRGQRTRDLLAKLIAFDLHPRAFPSGKAVSTNIAKVVGWVHCIGNAERAGSTGSDIFHLMVRRSQADYVWCLLAEAGREWGLPAQDPVGQVKLHLPHFDG